MAADDHAEIALLKKRLAELDVEREGLLASLEQLQQRNNADAKLSSQVLNAASAATARSNAEKVTLFRSLFRGRDDVFPLRWENSNSGKAGYSPECHNEWVRGICEKPRVKCSDCPNQAFVPVTDDIARSHLHVNQIRLQTSRIRKEHRPIRYQLPARLSFRQGQVV